LTRYALGVDQDLIVRAELARQQEAARVTINRGIVVLAMVPLVLLAAAFAAIAINSATAVLLAILGAGAYVFVGAIGGIALITSGAIEHRRIAKQLRAIDEPRQLPAARLVVR